MYYMLNLLIVFFLLTCLLFTINVKNVLTTLINLEFMAANTVYMIYIMFNLMNLQSYFIVYFLTIWMCEGVLSLSILVYMIKNAGNDYLTHLNLLKW